MAKRGRPIGSKSIIIDYVMAEKLAKIFCTHQEISALLGVSLSTLEHDKQFIAVHKKGIETAKMSLRRKQFKLAEKNAAMAIFLGKNYLGQRDTWDINVAKKEIISIDDFERLTEAEKIKVLNDELLQNLE